MKKSIKFTIELIILISGITTLILNLLIHQGGLIWIAPGITIAFAIVRFIFNFMPEYSTNKCLNWLYNNKFLGEYKNNTILSNTFYDDKMHSSIREDVTLIAELMNDKVYIHQKTSTAKNKNNEIIKFSPNKDSTEVWFKFETEHINELKEKETHEGIQYVKFIHKDKGGEVERYIEESYYYNSKPAFGKYK